MTTDTKAVARSQFETYRGGDLRRNASGEYTIWSVENDWMLWQAALAASRAEVEGLKKDAERYRWLRDRKFSFSHDEEKRGIAGSRWGDWPYDTDEGHAAVMDKAIDAAMEKGNV